MRFIADLCELPAMLGHILSEASKVGLPEDELRKIELASEEALVNIIHHAYPGDLSGTIEIVVTAPEGRRLSITITDQGLAFNPLETEIAVDPHAPLETRTVGGLGLYLIQRLMDDVRYERSHDSNILILEKK